MTRPFLHVFPSVAIAGAFMHGCASPPSPGADTARPTAFTILEARIDALPGRTLVVPVRPGPDTRENVNVIVEDDRGNVREFEGRLHRVTVTVEPGSTSWLPPAGAWRTEPFERRARDEAVTSTRARAGAELVSTMLSVDLPLDVRSGWMSIERARVKFNVLGLLASAGTVTGREEAALVTGRTLTHGLESPASARLLEPERRNPLRRWRYRLLAGAESFPVAPESFRDPFFEALAAQEEARWTWAFRALAKVDRELAARLVGRLTATTDFGSGVVAPTWPASQGDLGSLLSDLLDPALDGRRRAERAEAFLLSQPIAAAWVADDEGTPDAATKRPMAVLGVANLSERSTLAAATLAGPSLEAVDPRELPAWTSRMLFVSALESSPQTSSVNVVIGSWRRSLPVLLGTLPVAPPGVSLGPLLADYSLDTWLAGAAAGAGDPARTCAAMLLKKDRAWTLYVECTRPGASPGDTLEDTVRIWIGPTARPRLVVRVGESGYTHVEQELRSVNGGPDADRATRSADRAPLASVASRPDKWVCELSIPEWCIEPDGTIRIGLERIDSVGLRSAYPRAMLPWQTEPGRVLLDTRAWGR